MSEPSHSPTVYPREQHKVSRSNISDAARKVLAILNEEGFEACLVGGAVRDLLLDRQPKDYDVATNAEPEELRRVFRSCRLIGRRFRLAHVRMFGETIEVSTFRANIATEEAAEPAEGTFVAREDGLVLRDNVYGTPETDALRRDFTINALFYNMRDFSVIDYVGGMQDIRDRVIRSIGPADVRYTEDPVRMIRAVRIAAQLDFTIEPSTLQAILDRRDHLAHANPSRLFEEVKKLLWCGAAERVIDLLVSTGLFGILFPELSDVGSRDMELAWLKRVTRQFDIWYRNGLDISTELMLALLFGKFHEQQAAALMEEGMSEPMALDVASREHLTRLATRIAVPKFLAAHIGQIMGMQPRFLVLKDKSVARLKHRPVFHDAFIYFKLNGRFSNRHVEEVTWWEQHAR